MASKDWVSAEKQDKNSDQIEEKLVPELRFSEFDDEWKEFTLGNISSKEMYGINAPSKEFDGLNKYIRITDISDNSNKYIPNPLTSPDSILENKFKLKKGDIVFARTGASTGKSYLYDEADGNLYFAGFLIRFHIDKANPQFIFYNTLTEKYLNWVSIMSVRSGQPGINAKEYKKLKINLPSIEEQNKIVGFISKIDLKIDLMEKTLFLYERFAKEFIKNIYLNLNTSNKVKLRDIVDSYISNLSISNLDDNEGEYPLYGAEGVVKYINFYEMKNQYISIIKDGAGVGRLNLCNQYSSALGTLQCLIPKKEFDLHFIYYYLKNLNFKKYIVGSTIPHIYFNDYSKEKLNIPPLDIQRKYEKQCLTLEMKKKIIENAIISLKQYKKYLLQNLFI